MGSVALGSIAAPVLVQSIGSRAAFVVIGSILPMLILVTYRRLLEIDRGVAPAPELELIEQVPIFAPLSIAAKERVAAKLVPLLGSCRRARDPSRRYRRLFLHRRRRRTRHFSGGLHTTAHQADYFGEIALLQDVPRTATVEAIVDTKLYALDRNDFLAAVTGASAAHAIRHAVPRNGWHIQHTARAHHPGNRTLSDRGGGDRTREEFPPMGTIAR